MSSISSFQSLSQNFQTLGSLERGERLSVGDKDKIFKYQSPDVLLKNSKNIFAKGLHHLLTFALKIIQALGRLFRGQTVGKDIRTLDGLADLTTVLLNKEKQSFLNSDSPVFYEALSALGQIHWYGTKATDVGLKNYQATLLSGEADLIRDNQRVRTESAKEVEEISQKINEKVLIPMLATIEEMEENVLSRDKIKTEIVVKSFIQSGQVGEETFITTKAVKAVIADLYGESAFDRAIERMNLVSERVLSDDAVRALIVSIVANVTLEDLEKIYENRDNQIFNFPKDVGAFIKDFKELSVEETVMLLRSVRNVNYKTVSVSENHPSSSQLKHNKYFLDGLNEMCEYSGKAEAGESVGDLKKFAYAEYFAHDLVYRLFKEPETTFSEGVLIPFFDKKNNISLNEVHTLVSNSGLHGVTFEPVCVPEDAKKVRVQVVFRGTNCNASVKRDTSFSEKEFAYGFEGPGRMSFKAQEEVMIQRLQSRIDIITASGEKGRKVCLEFMGHSLGGSDAMRKLELYTDHLVNNEEDRVKVYGMNLFAFNSPAIESDKVLRFSQNVAQLPYPFKLRYFDAHGDAVQEFGKTRLGYLNEEADKIENMFVSIIKSDRDEQLKVDSLTKDFIGRQIAKAKRALRSHLAFVMKNSELTDSKKQNNAYIESFITDYPKDGNLRFGHSLENKAQLYTIGELNDKLLTLTGRIANFLNEKFSLSL